MNAEVFAEWLRRRGQRVVRTDSSYWHEQGPRVYQAFPYHWVIRPPDEELRGLLKRQRALGLRYSTPLQAETGLVSYHAVCRSPYELGRLGKWARKNVRRGLRCCTAIEPVSLGTLAEVGWRLQADTLARQGRHVPGVEMWWRQLCAAADLPGFEAWGAFVGARLAASVMTFQMRDWVYMLYQQTHRDFLTAHASNALCFVVTQSVLERPGVHSVLYGLHSLDAPPSVDEFKFRMGYAARPVRQRVVFHPWLTPLFNRTTHSAVSRLAGRLPHCPFITKTEGMLRFYLDGQKRADRQPLPPPLRPTSSRSGHGG